MSEDQIPSGNEDKLQEIMSRASVFADEKDQAYITTEHLLGALMVDEDIKKVLIKASENEQVCADITLIIANYLDSNEIPEKLSAMDSPEPVDAVKSVIDRAVARAKLQGSDISPVDVLVAIINEDDTMARYALMSCQLTSDNITESAEELGIGMNGVDEEDPNEPDWKKYLRQYCDYLNEKAKKGRIDNLIGREGIVEQIIETLNRRSKNNVILVGDPGVGKTAIVEGFAKRVVNGSVPSSMKTTNVWSLDIGRLLAGTRYRGDVEDRVTKIIAALKQEENATLFIDEIHTIMGAGKASDGGPDVSNLLKPELARGELKIIGSTTDAEYRKDFEKDRAIIRRFNKIVINEPSVDEAIDVLKGTIKEFEKFHGVSYKKDTIEEAVKLSVRYMPTKVLPDKAFDIIDIAGARVKLLNNDPERKPKITIEVIEEVVSHISGVPVSKMNEEETDQLKNLETNIRSSVFEQEEAIDKLCNAVYMARAGLRPSDKTAGAYLLVGPTGVGKTEICKSLANTLGIELVRFDMSEYTEQHTISKLIGSPPGYVGYDDPKIGDGKLVNEAEKHPYALFLFDEIEKAHPNVYQLFLQIMDDGKITSSSGKTVSFQNIIVVMTSNAGASEMSRSSIGFGGSSGVNMEVLDKAVERTFTPEFRNRLDAVVKFHPLSSETMIKIVEKFIANLNKLSNEKKVTIEVSTEAKEWLSKKGYDPKMGARPLQHLINNEISKPLAKLMLFGNLSGGGIAEVTLKDNTIHVGVKEEELVH